MLAAIIWRHTMNKPTTIFLTGLTFLTFFAGVIRDDVKEEEYLSLAKQPQFDCVGQVFKGAVAKASCVLIANKYVLSAAHVFIASDHRLDTLKISDQTIVVNQPINKHVDEISNYYFSFNGKKYQGSTLSIYPSYLDSFRTCDIAVIELREIVGGIKCASLNNSFTELHSTVIGVGFGASGVANKPESVNSQSKKIAGENVIDTLTGYVLNTNSTVLTADFDSPSHKEWNKMGNSIPLPLEYMPSGGDSGGGLFREKSDSTWELIGICAETNFEIDQFKKTGYYGSTMGWTRVSVFSKWIQELLK